MSDFYSYVLNGDFVAGARFVGSFYWYNQMAGFLLFIIPLLLNLAITVRKTYFKLLFGLFSGFTFFLLVLTQSRAGWLSMFGGLVLFAILGRKQIKSFVKPIAALLAVLIVFVFVFHPTSLFERVGSIKSEVFSESRTSSGNLRTAAWGVALRMIKERLLTGVGPGAYGALYSQYQELPWMYAKNAHNYFLEIAAETGIPGFVLFSSILIYAAYRVVKERNTLFDEKKHPLVLGVTTALFASILHSLLDVDWGRIALFSLFWIFLGILFANFSIKPIEIKIKGIAKFIYLFPALLAVVSIYLLVAESSYSWAKANFEDGFLDESNKLAVRAVTLNPYDKRYSLLLAKLRKAEGKNDDARVEFERLTLKYPHTPEPYYEIGLLEYNEGNYEAASDWFKRSIEANKFISPQPYIALSNSYEKLGQIDEAASVLQHTIDDIFPLNDYYMSFGYLYEAVGRKEELGDAYFALANLRLQQGRKDGAAKLVDIAEKEFKPPSSVIRGMRGQIAK